MCHIGRVCLDLRSVRRRFALRVTPIRLLLVLAVGVVAPVATCLAAATVSAATADSAVSSDTVADGFNEDLASETPELAANQWGWRLTKYYELWNIYAIRGTLYLRLVADIHSDSGIIWSPLTGRGAHLDSQAFKKFAIDYEKNRIFIPLGVVHTPIPLPDGRSIESQYTPGGSWRCSPLFDEYYSVFNKNKK